MILLIDSYDSFTNNLSRLIEQSTNKDVIVIHNDTISPEKYQTFLCEYLDFIDYIVIGPGPGLPDIASDVGIIPWLFRYFLDNTEKVVPIFGICLGFQCLCFEFNNQIKKLDDIKHGQVYDIIPVEEKDGLFKSLFGKKIPSVRYHSLFIDIKELSTDIIPLAICYENDYEILMAGKHKLLPFYGVQYHPESICTEEGSTLVKNFDIIAEQYNKNNRHHIYDLIRSHDNPTVKKLKIKVDPHPLFKGGYTSHDGSLNVFARELIFNADEVLTIDICDLLNENDDNNFILLNSASVPGQWSIIGLPEIGKSEVITHSVDAPHYVKLLKFKSDTYDSMKLEGLIWKFVAEKFAENYVSRNSILKAANLETDLDFPFLGGFLGLFSYEEGQHVIIEELGKYCNHETPDLKLVFIERFLLLDNVSKKWFYFSVNINQDDRKWSEEFVAKLQTNYRSGNLKLIPVRGSSVGDLTDKKIEFKLPDERVYKDQFKICQDFLHSGDSYEICLTTPLKIYLPSNIKAWDIYKILLTKNPSPYSCFMNFEDLTLISSSPERFVSWKGDNTKTVELKPIKGTVKNTPDIDINQATKILKTPKEMGENLMIVDLIRHDLHQYIDDVKVPHLMAVEEYKTVFQLVTTVMGELDNSKDYHGIDILHTSLPPGSMTGAPKKRSVEFIQKLEEMQPNAIKGGRRGIYSGVVGYWSITDDSDWSVIIRSVFHYKDDRENNDDTTLWRIGAGGAITVLSNTEDEWEEMKIKLLSALQAFS